MVGLAGCHVVGAIPEGGKAGRGQGRAFPELMGLLLSIPGPHGEGKTAEGSWARTSGAL